MADFEVFTTDIALRFRDVDAMGHVNNAVYFTYFDYQTNASVAISKTLHAQLGVYLER